MEGETRPAWPVLLTGASGQLGQVLTKRLGDLGWNLRLTDVVPFPNPLPQSATFTLADLGTKEGEATIETVGEGCKTIIHLGAVSTEHSFEDVLGPNILGVRWVYEFARRQKARVIYASSNHAFGFHKRTEEPLDAHSCEFLPDGEYGLSKAFGECVAKLCWMKHGTESVVVRIGSCFERPCDARMLSTWLSYSDFTDLCVKAVLKDKIGLALIWGCSNNARSFWGKDDRALIGWTPKDSADEFSDELKDEKCDNPIAESYQGGSFAAMNYTNN